MAKSVRTGPFGDGSALPNLHDAMDRDQLSLMNGIEFDPAEDKTRQEDKVSTDINFVLARSGVAPRTPQYGVFDFDLDLHTAYQQAQELRDGFARLDPAVQEKYGDYPSLLEAISTGKVRFAGGKFEEVVEAPPSAPPPAADVPPNS